MFNVRLAAGYLYGKWLFTWLSLVTSLMMVSYFVLSFFSQDILDGHGTELSKFLIIFIPTLSNRKWLSCHYLDVNL